MCWVYELKRLYAHCQITLAATARHLVHLPPLLPHEGVGCETRRQLPICMSWVNALYRLKAGRSAFGSGDHCDTGRCGKSEMDYLLLTLMYNSMRTLPSRYQAACATSIPQWQQQAFARSAVVASLHNGWYSGLMLTLELPARCRSARTCPSRAS